MNEAAFLAQLTDEPDDDVTLLVYADWLEDDGQHTKADFIRAQEKSRRLTNSRAGVRRTAREVVALGSRLPQSWLEIVSRPRLMKSNWAGVAWVGGLPRRNWDYREINWCCGLEFQPGGTLRVTPRSLVRGIDTERSVPRQIVQEGLFKRGRGVRWAPS
jgi:uncharacterized protein (TIGR02996 family)